MPNLNKFMLIGNLTRDVETRTVRGDTTVADFGMAVNRKYRTQDGQEKEDVLFIDLAAFGKVAEILGQYARKGKLMYVEGRLKLDQWDDKQTGAKRTKITGVVENFQFLSPKDDPDSPAGAFGDGGGSARQREQERPASRPAAQSQRQGLAGGGGRVRPAPARQQAAPAEGPPFGDEQHFDEADIPFAWPGRVSTANL